MEYRLEAGNFEKPGVSAEKKRAVFTIECSRNAECCIIFYDFSTKNEIETIRIPEEYSIGNLRSVTITGIDVKKYLYNFKIDGVLMTDPYAKRIYGRETFGTYSSGEDPSVLQPETPRPVYCMACQSGYAWSTDKRIRIPERELILYKLHVRAFTMEAKLPSRKRGTFAGAGQQIPYLKELGITAVELMPVYEFEELQWTEDKPQLLDYESWKNENIPNEKKQIPVGHWKFNVWGYKKADYFAPKSAYAAGKDPEMELKELISEFHNNNIEVILEFFFENGENPGYILEVLRYWVREYHADGFHLLGLTVPVDQIVRDPLLADTRIFYSGFAEELIREPMQENRLFVCNDEYLYPVRKMLNRRDMDMGQFLDRLTKQHDGEGFVNYITSNNGFTMADLFSYEKKHNEENGENGLDGNDWNYSANCGTEGPSRKKQVKKIRHQLMRNAFAVLFLSKGVPLVYEGDEIANSKGGNNNTYCIDSPVSYVNWKNLKTEKEMLEFVKKLAAFRKSHPVIAGRSVNSRGIKVSGGLPELSCHGENAWQGQPGAGSGAAGILYCGEYYKKADGQTDDILYTAYNFSVGRCRLALPKLPGGLKWRRIMDTSRETEPFFFDGEPAADASAEMEPRSVCIFMAEKSPAKKERLTVEKRKTRKKAAAEITETSETAKAAETVKAAETTEIAAVSENKDRQ